MAKSKDTTLTDLVNDLNKLDPPAGPSLPALEPEVPRNADAPTVIIDAPAPASTVDLKKAQDRLDTVTEEVLRACRGDREETQEVINMLRQESEKFITAGKPPDRGVLESLVKALEVKSNINTTAVKILEANNKFIAAQKAGVGVTVNATVGGTDRELMGILQNADDDRY